MVRSTALLRKAKLVLNALVPSGNYLLWVMSAQERLTDGTFTVGGGELTKVSCKLFWIIQTPQEFVFATSMSSP
jgi:hypothetical protein